MLPDVIDESMLTRDVRREELFYAFFVFVNKFCAGLSLGLSTAAYKYVCGCISIIIGSIHDSFRLAGYDESSCEQPWTVPLALKLIIAVPPFIVILITFIFLHRYPITEKRRKATKKLLAEIRFANGGGKVVTQHTHVPIKTVLTFLDLGFHM